MKKAVSPLYEADRLFLFFNGGTGFCYLSNHDIEGLRKCVDFALSGELFDWTQVAFGHFARAFGKLHDGRRYVSGKCQSKSHRPENRKHHRQSERDAVDVPQA